MKYLNILNISQALLSFIPLSEVFEFRYMLSMRDEECLCGVVWAHLVLLLESGLGETEFGDATVQIREPEDRNQTQPDRLVAQA